MSDLYWLEPVVFWGALLVLVRGAFWKEVVGMSRTVVVVSYGLCLEVGAVYTAAHRGLRPRRS